MKNQKTIRGTVHVIRREESSANGNPRWLVHVVPTDGADPIVCLTKPDAAIAYGIQNPENADTPRDWYVGTYYGRTHVSDC